MEKPRVTQRNTEKVPVYGANRTLHIHLPDKYWDVLFAMTQIEGSRPEDYAEDAIKCIIRMDLDAPEQFGELLTDRWREILGNDKWGKSSALISDK